MAYSKPLPKITSLDRPYWEAAKRHRLSIQRCEACRTYRYPASPVCASCDSDAYQWSDVSGRGEMLSWVVFHRCYFPSFAAEMPYNVAIVTLAEGVDIVSNVLAPNESLYRGMPVEAVFEDATDEVSILKFKPLTGSKPA